MLPMALPVLTPYHHQLYDMIVPVQHLWRRMKELVQLDELVAEVEKSYCVNNGREAVHPVIMLKYLLVKAYYTLSDVDLVERAQTDLAIKFFLGVAPESPVIHPSSLTKFRRQRLKDVAFLPALLKQTIRTALEKGVLTSTAIIVDATHTAVRYNPLYSYECFIHHTKKLRQAVYQVRESVKTKFPPKPVTTQLVDHVEYSCQLIDIIRWEVPEQTMPAIQEKLHLVEELVEDYRAFQSNDEDARIGHKAKDDSFYGYKSHLAMTSGERLITAAVITSGEQSDGKFLMELVQHSEANGLTVETIIGDAAYSEKGTLQATQEKDIQLVAKLNPVISNGNRKEENRWEFNKDAGMMVCPAGHLATRTARTGAKNRNTNQTQTYYFDIEKCQVCPLREGCYRDGAKSKTYSVSLLSNVHAEQKAFQETPVFREWVKQRYKIEAENSELKNRHGLERASSTGLSFTSHPIAGRLFQCPPM